MTNFFLFLRLMPMIWELVKAAKKRIKEGATIDEVNRAFERINNAFSQENRAKGAAMLDDIWMRSSAKDKTKD